MRTDGPGIIVENGILLGRVTFLVLLFVALDSVIDLAAVDRYFFRSLDSQPHLVPADFHDNDRDVIVDDNTFVLLAG